MSNEATGARDGGRRAAAATSVFRPVAADFGSR
jgi:hypothetical protein